MNRPPQKMHVTTDAVAVSCSRQHGLRVLLIERGHDPYRGRWALPGGFVDLDEDLPEACARELHEETGVGAAAMVQIGAWGTPGRDPRGRNISVVYLAVIRAGDEQAQGGDDAVRADWHPIDALPPLAFDHQQIVAAAAARLRSLVRSTHLVFAFLPERFRLEDLSGLLAAVLDTPANTESARELADRARLVREATGWTRCTATDYLAPLEE